MEEVEQFEDISIEELAEGMQDREDTAHQIDLKLAFCRTSRKLPSIRCTLLRAQTQ